MFTSENSAKLEKLEKLKDSGTKNSSNYKCFDLTRKITEFFDIANPRIS